MLEQITKLMGTALALVGLFPFLTLVLFVLTLTYRHDEFGDYISGYFIFCTKCGLAISAPFSKD